MRRSVWLFLLLLIAIGVFLHYDWRVLGLFKAATLLNTVICIWYLKHIFSPPEDQRRYPVIQAVLCTLLLLFNGLVFIGVYSLYQQSKAPVTVLSRPVPAFEWTALDGGKHRLSELKGRILVLHFWASWCGPCREEFPELLAFAKAHPEITVLAFDVRDDPEKARRFIERIGADIAGKSPPNLLFAADPDSELSGDIFKIETYPSSIMVDPQGIMRRKYARPVRWKDNWMVSDWHHWAQP